jgi:hypothetical protein
LAAVSRPPGASKRIGLARPGGLGQGYVGEDPADYPGPATAEPEQGSTSMVIRWSRYAREDHPGYPGPATAEPGQGSTTCLFQIFG